jgi:hypothetical protein
MDQISAQIDYGFARGDAFVPVFHVRRETGGKNMPQIVCDKFRVNFHVRIRNVK